MTLSGTSSVLSAATTPVCGCPPGAASPDGGPRAARGPIERVFSVVDANRDGSIDTLELSDLFERAKSAGVDPGMDAEAVMSALDGNGDHAISKDEFQKAADALRQTVHDMGLHRGHARGREFRALFGRLDANHDGGIDAAEMDTELSRLAASRGSSDGLPTSAEVMQALDRNGDGAISARELRRALKHHHDAHDASAVASPTPASSTQAEPTSETPASPTSAPSSTASATGGPTSSPAVPSPATASSSATPPTQLSYLQTTTFSFSMQVVVQRYVSVTVAGQAPSSPQLSAQA